MEIKYFDKLQLCEGCTYITYVNGKYRNYKSFEKALMMATPTGGVIQINIKNPNASNKDPNKLEPVKDCYSRSILSDDRCVYISPAKDEIYGEWFCLNIDEDRIIAYSFDYGFLFGDVPYYHSGTHLKSTLHPEKDVIIYFEIGEFPSDRCNGTVCKTKEELLNRMVPYVGCDVNLIYHMIGEVVYDGEMSWASEIYVPGSTLYE